MPHRTNTGQTTQHHRQAIVGTDRAPAYFAGALSPYPLRSFTLRKPYMPAKEFVEAFSFDPATFNYDQFKTKLIAELDGDTDLSTAALTAVTEERDTLSRETSGLKVRLFDATIGKQGDPVLPIDSPASAAGSTPNPATAVKESDIFEKVE